MKSVTSLPLTFTSIRHPPLQLQPLFPSSSISIRLHTSIKKLFQVVLIDLTLLSCIYRSFRRGSGSSICVLATFESSSDLVITETDSIGILNLHLALSHSFGDHQSLMHKYLRNSFKHSIKNQQICLINLQLPMLHLPPALRPPLVMFISVELSTPAWLLQMSRLEITMEPTKPSMP